MFGSFVKVAMQRALGTALVALTFLATPSPVFAGDAAFDLTRKADRLAEEKQYDQALALYARALKMAPQSSEARFNRGNVYFDLHDFPHAIADYKKGIELHRKWADSYPVWVLMNLADAYRLNGDTAQAIAAYENFLRTYPKAGLAPKARNWIAQLRLSSGSSGAAATALTFKDERRFCAREISSMMADFLRVNAGTTQEQSLDFATRRFYAQINLTDEGLLRQNIQRWTASTRPDNQLWVLDLCAAKLSLGRLVGIKQAQQRARHESVDIESLVEVIPPGSPKSANPGG